MVTGEGRKFGVDYITYEDHLAIGLECVGECPQVVGRQAECLDDSAVLVVDHHGLPASAARTRLTGRIAIEPSAGTVTTSRPSGARMRRISRRRTRAM